MKLRTLSVGTLGTNCYLVWDDNREAAVIDPGADEALILDTLQKEGLTVKAVLLTHAHFDHIGAAKAVMEATGADLYIHEDDAAALNDRIRNLSDMFGASLSPLKAAHLLRDGDAVSVGALTFTVLHTPGHTPGSCCYLCGDWLFSGDTLFCQSIGRTDFPGGDMMAILRSLHRLTALSGEYRVLPGHDEETTLSSERQHNPYCI